MTEKTDSEREEKEDVSKEKLPFPEASIVRIMKKSMDKEKKIKKEVKIAMNKYLARICANISKDMNRVPYVMMNVHEFNEAKRIYDKLEDFDNEKKRILSHLDAMKRDIERLEKDLGKVEADVVKLEG